MKDALIAIIGWAAEALTVFLVCDGLIIAALALLVVAAALL